MNKFRRIITPEGVAINYVKNNVSKATLIDILFNCGARCDTIPGLAHFTEHMFFTGTKDLSKEEITKKYFDLIDVNAFTSTHDITFTGNIFTKELDKYLSTVATMISESTFSQAAVDKEIKVVQQEIARSADKYNRKAFEFNRYNICNDNVSKYSILGSKDSVASIKSKDVKAFVKKYFIRENMEIYISSPMSFGKVKQLVYKKLISKIPSNKAFKPLPLYYYYIKNDDFLNIKTDKIDKSYVNLNFFSKHNNNEHEYKVKLDLVLRMLNDISEGIKKDIRLKKSLVYGGGFHSVFNDVNGGVHFETECDPENINELLSTIASYLDNLSKTGFTAEQLAKAKREIQYSEETKEPRASKNMSKLYNYKYFGKIIDQEKLIKLSKSLTLADCNEVFNELFMNNRVALSIYGNADKSKIINKREFNKLFRSH